MIFKYFFFLLCTSNFYKIQEDYVDSIHLPTYMFNQPFND